MEWILWRRPLMKNNSTKATVILMMALIALAWLAIKISLPALPSLGVFFGVKASFLKLSISLFLGSLALSQLIWGAVLDSLGRKRTLFIALGITFYGALMVMSSYSVVIFIVGRIIEGVGVGGFSPTGRAVFVDLFPRQKVAKYLAYYSGIAGVMPFVAPLVGGYLLFLSGWRSIFLFYMVLILIYAGVFTCCFKETSPEEGAKHPIANPFFSYRLILKSRLFWGYIICYMGLSGVLLGYYSSMPFWFVTTWHIKEQLYAYLSSGTVAFYILGLVISRYLVTKVGITLGAKMMLTSGSHSWRHFGLRSDAHFGDQSDANLGI